MFNQASKNQAAKDVKALPVQLAHSQAQNSTDSQNFVGGIINLQISSGLMF